MALSTRTPSRPVLSAARARQGRFGQHVFWVLVFGTLLAALGLFAAWGWKGKDTTGASSREPPAAASSPASKQGLAASPTP